MFCPTWRRDIAVDIARPQPDPVHGREMSNRIRDVRMQHELGLRRRTRREVELHRIAGPRLSVRLKFHRSIVPILVSMPSGRSRSYNNARATFLQLAKPRYAICSTHDVPHTTSFNAVGQIFSAEKRRCRQDDATKFDERQNRLPKGRQVAKHYHDAVAPIQGPIEAVQLWPLKASAGKIVLGTIF